VRTCVKVVLETWRTFTWLIFATCLIGAATCRFCTTVWGLLTVTVLLLMTTVLFTVMLLMTLFCCTSVLGGRGAWPRVRSTERVCTPSSWRGRVRFPQR